MPCFQTQPGCTTRQSGGRDFAAPAAAETPALVLVLVLGMLLGACQAQPTMPGPGPRAVDEAGLRQRITDAVGPASCIADADCQTLPMGVKSCGGPASWLAWSTRQSDGAQLSALAAELAARQRQRLEAAGIASTCSVVPDPGAACRAGRCVLNDAAGRSPSAR